MAKCKKIDGIWKCNKQSYNPFKMWGSYVGAFLGLITPTAFLYVILFHCTKTGGTDCGMLAFAFYPIQIFVLATIPIGFLIGWGVTYLYRRFIK